MLKSRLSISLPSYNNPPISSLCELAKLADDTNLETVWAYEMLHNPCMLLGALAPHTKKIKLGTGIMQAFTRSPVVAANLAADVDELSDGRMVMGIAPGSFNFLEAWHNTDLKNVVQRMREYISVVRTTWACVGEKKPGDFNGDFYSVHFGSDQHDDPFGGYRRNLVRPEIPIYLGCTKPRLLQLAGEMADGQHGYMYTPRYIEEVVYPNLEIGAKRTGRNARDVDVCLWLICGVHKDRREAMRRAKIHTGTHALGSEHLLRYAGLEKEWHALVADFKERGYAALEDTDDKIVETFSIAGTPDECREQLKRYDGLVPHLCLDTPYIDPMTPDEAEDSYRQIVEAFG